ncbi:MAG: hypothetical protein OEV95_03940, partial [Gemmatimonadota bacterium]|nr:hypothetical protein [Gemmatimonadota bacterium]
MTPFLAVVLLALAVAISAPSDWRRAAAWAALGLTGYAASLSLIEAGPFVRYQHYLPVQEWSRAPGAAFAVALEVLLVISGLWRGRSRIGDLLPPAWRGWRVAALAAMILLTSAALSRSPQVFLAELGLAGAIAMTHLGAAILAAMAIPADSAARLGMAANAWLDDARGQRAVTWAAIGTAVAAALLAWLVYERHPHVPDEVAYLLHARYFAAGLLWLPAPVPPEAFDTDLMFTSAGRWFSPVPPAWPAMLAVGVKLNAPWLVNPVFAGLNVALAAPALGAVTDRRTGRLGALLLAVSPWHLFLGMSFLTHTFTLTCTLLAVVMVARSRSTGAMGWMLAGGGLTGLVSLIRPLEGLAVAMALGLWSLRGPTLVARLLKGAVFTAGAMVVGAVTLPYNAA